MSSTTNFLKLTLPGNGEYTDSWDEVVNENFIDIDKAVEVNTVEIEEARLGHTSLKELLEISINNDGTLKATSEVVSARNSFIYGDEDSSSLDLDLPMRLNLLEKDLFYKRFGSNDFRMADSNISGLQCQVLSASKDANGYPTWMASTGVNVQIDGSVSNIIMSINGRLAKIRKQEQLVISGSVGVKNIYAQYNQSGVVRIDGSTLANGVISSDGDKVRWFNIPTSDFTVLDVKPGDILEILGTGVNAGQYQIKQIAPGGVVSRVLVYGYFKSEQAALNYKIIDPFAVTLGFDDVVTEAVGKFYLGTADFDGVAVTSVKAISFFDYFISEWRPIDVTTITTFTEAFNHNLLDDALDVVVQVSQVNNGSDYIEQLSTSELKNNLNISNALTISSGDQTLGGSVSLSGEIVTAKSVKLRWNKYRIEISSSTPNIFYKDFSGVVHLTGYVRVIARKIRK